MRPRLSRRGAADPEYRRRLRSWLPTMRRVVSGVLVPALAALGLELAHHTHRVGEAPASTSVDRACPRLPLFPHLHGSVLHNAERCPACAVGPAPSMAQAGTCGQLIDAPLSAVVLPDRWVCETHRDEPPAARGPPSLPTA